jgi:hypothetical protein
LQAAGPVKTGPQAEGFAPHKNLEKFVLDLPVTAIFGFLFCW